MATQVLQREALVALVLLICISLHVSLSDPTQLPTILYHEHITHPVGNYFQEELQIPASNRIIANYHITFRSEKCCPTLGFRQLRTKWETKAYYLACSAESLKFVALYSPVYIYTKEGFPTSGCRVTDGVYVCNGTRTLVSGVPVKWAFAVGYECGTQQNLDVTVDLEVKYNTNYKFPCEPMLLSYCSDIIGYNYTAFPNALSQPNQQAANRLMALLQTKIVTTTLKACYQHSYLLICRAMFPKCNKGNQLMPCQQMCQEAVKGCESDLLTIGQTIYCGWLLDSLDPDVCFYEPVRCPRPQPPEFGSLDVEGLLLMNITRYSCNNRYILKGDMERHCHLNGKWNGTTPVCLPEKPVKKLNLLLTVLMPILLAAAVVGIIIVLCIYHRKALTLWLFHNRYIFRLNKQHLEIQRKLFVSFSSEDLKAVRNEFLPELWQWLPTWTTVTYQEDFTPGRPLLDCIHEGVWDSQAVLVLLTENFIASNFCLFEFTEAETRSVIDQNFKLIVVLFTKDADKTHDDYTVDLPEKLREYVRTRVHLPLGERLFWNKLHRALHKVGYPTSQNAQPDTVMNAPV